MIRPILLSAALTGAFCAAFAVGIDYLTDMLERNQASVSALPAASWAAYSPKLSSAVGDAVNEPLGEH